MDGTAIHGLSPENQIFKNQLSMLSGRYNTLLLSDSTDLNAFNIFSRFEKIFNLRQQNEIITCLKDRNSEFYFRSYFTDQIPDSSIVGHVYPLFYVMIQKINCFNVIYSMNPYNFSKLLRLFAHNNWEFISNFLQLCVVYHEIPDTDTYDKISRILEA